MAYRRKEGAPIPINEQMLALKEAGKTTDEIAKQFNVTKVDVNNKIYAARKAQAKRKQS